MLDAFNRNAVSQSLQDTTLHSEISYHTDGNISQAPIYHFGINLGKLIGTVDANGGETAYSYPLDRFVNYFAKKLTTLSSWFSSKYNYTPVSPPLINVDLVEELDELLCSDCVVTELSENEYDRIARLLGQGIRPSQNKESEYSPFNRAIGLRNLQLTELLVSNNITPHQNDLNYIFPKLKTQRLEQPIPVENQIYESLCKGINSPQDVQFTVDYVSKTYENLVENVNRFEEEAYKQRKSLLILIGESHVRVESQLVEAMILNLLFTKYQIRDVMTEIFPSKNYSGWLVGTDILQMIESLGGKAFPIDFGYEDGQKDQTSENAVKFRNDRMFEAILKYTSESTSNIHVVIVGAGHLYGLAKETPLSDKFYTVSINASSQRQVQSKDRYHQICDAYIHSEEVFSMVPSKGLKISPNMAIQIAQTINNCHIESQVFSSCNEQVRSIFDKRPLSIKK